MIVVAQHRHGRIEAAHVLEQDVVVLAGMQGHGDPDVRGQIPRPHAAAQNHVVGVDAPAVGLHAAHALRIMMDGGDFEVLEDRGAAAAGALGERLSDIDGIEYSCRSVCECRR